MIAKWKYEHQGQWDGLKVVWLVMLGKDTKYKSTNQEQPASAKQNFKLHYLISFIFLSQYLLCPHILFLYLFIIIPVFLYFMWFVFPTPAAVACTFYENHSSPGSSPHQHRQLMDRYRWPDEWSDRLDMTARWDDLSPGVWANNDGNHKSKPQSRGHI